MKLHLAYIYVFAILAMMAVIATPATIPTDVDDSGPSTDVPELTTDSSAGHTPSPSPLSDSAETQRKARYWVSSPIQQSVETVLAHHYPIFEVEPSFVPLDSDPVGYDDIVDVGPTPIEASRPLELVPLDGLSDPNIVRYTDEGEMQTAESNIVFRPLFAYRRQTAQRRRIYSRPAPAPATPSPSRNSNRRQQAYPYGYPSYGYPNYYYYPSNSYPNYYYNAPYEYVS